MPESTVILDAAAIQRALTRIAHEIAERNEVGAEVVLIGIPQGGVPLSQRLSAILAGIWNQPVPVGTLDVSMPATGLIPQNSDPLAIGANVQAYVPPCGCNEPGYFFNGLIDEVSIYNRALTAQEIQAI